MGGGRGDGIGCAVLTVEAGPEPERRGEERWRCGAGESSRARRGEDRSCAGCDVATWGTERVALEGTYVNNFLGCGAATWKQSG